MASAATATVMRMLESLPEELQDRVLERVRDYIEDIREEAEWDHSFSQTQPKLAEAARQTRKAISEGKATPLDIDKL